MTNGSAEQPGGDTEQEADAAQSGVDAGSGTPDQPATGATDQPATAPDAAAEGAPEEEETVTTEDQLAAASAGPADSLVGQAPSEESEDSEDSEESEEKAEKPDDERELPPNKYSELYYELRDEIEKNPKYQNSPFAKAILSGLFFLGKYYSVINAVNPAGFYEGLEDSEGGLVNEKFGEADLNRLRESLSKDPVDIAALDEQVPLPKPEEGDERPKFSAERIATRYVSRLLGVEEIDSAAVLAAKLLHAEEGGKKYYTPFKSGKLDAFKSEGDKKRETFPKGSVVFFVEDLMSGQVISAYATGNGDEFVYYSAEEKKREKFNLHGKNSPVSAFTFRAAFLSRIGEVKAEEKEEKEKEKEKRAEAKKKKEEKAVMDKVTPVETRVNELKKKVKTNAIIAGLRATRGSVVALGDIENPPESVKTKITEIKNAYNQIIEATIKRLRKDMQRQTAALRKATQDVESAEASLLGISIPPNASEEYKAKVRPQMEAAQKELNDANEREVSARKKIRAIKKNISKLNKLKLT